MSESKTEVHFINVGQGNMTLIICENGAVICYDCNIKDDNEKEVFSYLTKVMPQNKKNIDVFISSHREADHIRGIKKIHNKYPIASIWDSGQSGKDVENKPEYQEYMALKREIKNGLFPIGNIMTQTGLTEILCLNSSRENETDLNRQSIILKITHNNSSSVLLTGDTDAYVWKEYIMKENKNKLKSSILLASHHGSDTFFYINNEEYIDHIKTINPNMTIISVGENGHGHPDIKATRRYEDHSTGGDKKELKIVRTDKHGNIKLELKDNHGWSLIGSQ